MRVGYTVSAHEGAADRPPQSSADVARTVDNLIQQGVTAARSGFHSLQVADHHGRANVYLPGPEQAMAILARETERVALGSFSLVHTLVHPMKTAEQFAMVDQLSKGRVYATVSRGFDRALWKQFGIPQERLLGRFKEAIRIWEMAFAGQRFDFAGEFWQVEDGLLAPPPFQEGGWPIWGGGNANMRAIARSAEYGACWTCDQFPLHKPTWDEQVGAYKQRAEELGKVPFVVLLREAIIADTYEEALAVVDHEIVPELRRHFLAGILTHHPGYESESDITAESVAPHLIIGKPQDCREQLERFHHEFGADYLTVRLRCLPGTPPQVIEDQIARFGEEVAVPIHRDYAAITHPAIPAACHW